MEQLTTLDIQTEKRPNFLRRIQASITSSRSSYLAFCFIVPIVLAYLMYLAREIHPFGDGSVLVLDLSAQYVYFFEALRDFAHGDADLLYSFSRSLGGEFVGIYAYYVASPLSYIVALFPKAMMLEALLTLFLLKCGLCGFTFGFYLHKNSKNPNRVMVIAFSVMYALSAYGIVHQHNTMWIDAMIWLPLVTYGIEQLVKFGKFKLFVIALAITLWSNFYIGYMVCIYVAIYFFYYLIAYGDGKNNPRGEKAHNLRSFIRIVVFSAIAIAIAAFIVLGAYYALSFGKNEFTSPNWTPRLRFNFLDFFTKFLPGAYDTVRPEGLPFVYTGMLTLILLPVYFMSRKISSREKVASLGLLGIFALSFSISSLDLIWHGFQEPVWLNNRYSFIFGFIVLVLAYKAFGLLREASEKFLLAIGAFIVLFIAVAEKQTLETYVKSEDKLLAFECVWLSIVAAVVITLLLCLLVRTKNVRKRENIAGILVAVICIELFCNGLTCMNQLDKDVAYSGYNGYNTPLKNLREVTDFIKEQDSSFYRTEQIPRRAVNDSMALGTKGVSGSTSTLNLDTIAFMHNLGYTGTEHWTEYAGENPVTDALLGIKYVVGQKNTSVPGIYYPEIYTGEKYIAYKNPYALSLAYGVNSAVKDFSMVEYKSHFERLNALVSAMTGEQEDIFVPLLMNEIPRLSNCEMSSTSGHAKYTAISSTSPATVTFTATAPMNRCQIFFYAPSDFPREAKIKVNGKDVLTYFTSNTNRIISLGVFTPYTDVETGNYITPKIINLEFTLEGEDLYLLKNCNYFYYIDMDAFESAFAKLGANPQLQIDEGFTDSHFTGSIKTENQNQMILTTIPYDEGWQITVDGKPVEIYETLDALIAFDIADAGDHSLEFRYAPRIYKLATLICITGISLFIMLCIIDKFFRPLFRRIMKLEEKNADDILWDLEDFDEDKEAFAALPSERKKTLKEKISAISGKLQRKKSEEREQDNNDTPNDGGN
ncbi:MAG: YfhO family protein [Clostridia bacterium]|nr:YfhO family protein [Clostridia bacterium]